MTPALRYPSIQIARAAAALAVLFAHSQALPVSLGVAPYSHGLWSFGQAGVDIFFVISGFIISAVLQRPQTVGQFAARRSLRILPFYWFFTLIWVALMLAGGHGQLHWNDLAVSLAVLPQDATPVLGVGWSLEHELVFYAIVALLIWLDRAEALLGVMIGLSVVSVLANLFIPKAVDDGLAAHFLTLYHCEFLAGVALYRWRSSIAAIPWKPMLLVGAILFPVTAAILHVAYGSGIPAQPHGWLGIARVALWGLAGVLVLGGLLVCETQQPDVMHTTPARWAITLGGASYVLYLSHPVAIEIARHVLEDVWRAQWPAQLAETIAIAAALIFALAFYRWIEEPLIRRLGKIADALAGREISRRPTFRIRPQRRQPDYESEIKPRKLEC